MYPKVSFSDLPDESGGDCIGKKAFAYRHLNLFRQFFSPGTVFAPVNSIAFHFTVRGRLPLILCYPFADG
jgi:hypothetical protein